MPTRHRRADIIWDLPEYEELLPWAAELCEQGYVQSLQTGRRRRAARMDFVSGWKEAARQLGRPDVFRLSALTPDQRRTV